MISDIVLSRKTQSMLAKIRALESSSIDLPDALRESAQPKLGNLLNWLNQQQKRARGQERFLLESLYASCLADLGNSVLDIGDRSGARKRNWRAIVKIVFLAILGLIYFGAEGFDGIASMLGLTALSGAPVFAIGVAFGVLWALVFFAVHLMEIAGSLGVNLINAPRMINVYTDQINSMKAIRKKISQDDDAIDEQRLQRNMAILAMLQKRMETLDSARSALKDALNNRILVAAKYGMAVLAGVILFMGGFMTGQTVALAFAALFMASVSPTAWPVILFCVFIGLAAFGFYWFVERHGIENLIGRCVGLDKEKVDAFCDKELIKKENKKLEFLQEKISLRVDELGVNRTLREENACLQTLLQSRDDEPLLFGYRRDFSEEDFSGCSNEDREASQTPGRYPLFFSHAGSETDAGSATLSQSQDSFDKGNGNFTLGGQ